MDVSINEVVFEGVDPSKPKADIPEGFDPTKAEVLLQLLYSDYYQKGGLCMDKFLEPDRTIDLEKFELAISLIIEWQEFFEKSKKPIYVNIRNMREYFSIRKIHLDDMDRITEESQFILGFASAVAQEHRLSKRVIVQYSN